MSMMLKRMFAYLTLGLYLVVGTVSVRVFAPKMTTVSFTTSYARFFSKTTFDTAYAEEFNAPQITFSEIRFPVEKKIVPSLAPKKIVVIKRVPQFKYETVAKNVLPFQEPIRLSAIQSNIVLNTQLATLYKEFGFKTAAPNLVQDEVSTGLAAGQDAEPEFFEYPADEAPANPQEKNQLENSTVAEVVNTVEKTEAVDNSTEEVAIDEIIAFDYSKANADVKSQSIPTVSNVTTQITGATSISSDLGTPSTVLSTALQQSKVPQVNPNKSAIPQEEKSKAGDKSSNFVKKNDYSSTVDIKIVGTDLKKTQEEVGFEVRFQDDLKEIVEDHNTGYATVSQKLTQRAATRPVTLLKRGYAPTNSDLIVTAKRETVFLPMILEEKFNQLLAPYEARGPIGAVLVERDARITGASLDVPYSEVLQLNENMQVTKGNDFIYQLFVGVKAGNALLSYTDANGKVTAKLIHVHERELSFEAFHTEVVENEAVSLLEEDLLSKEKTPLIISSEEVKEFVTGKTTTKLDDHTFKTDFGEILLGARKYIELTHLSESVFVGYKNKDTVHVPSEGFMRHVLSQFPGSNLGNRCVVQINLSKAAENVDVAAESLDSSIMAYTQVLDKDGKFYDSVGHKSKKVIIVGENQTSQEGLAGKINVKVTYEDGTADYLGSYCSPNTYLVEQL